MSKKSPIDFAAAMATLTVHAEEASEFRFNPQDDRFSRAATVLTTQPTGVTGTRTPPQQLAVAAQGTDVIRAAIADVQDNPCNARRIYDPAIIKERAVSIRKDGQMTPAPACMNFITGQGYLLIGGHYRKKALLSLGESEIELKLISCNNMKDLYRLSRVENDEREDGTPLDDAMAWTDLLAKGTFASQEEIAEYVNVPRVKITKTLKLLQLPETVLSVLKEAPQQFPLTVAYEFSMLAAHLSEAEQENMARQIISGELSSRDILKLREQLEAPKGPRKTKQISRQYKIVKEGQPLGFIKDWDTGKVMLEITLADPGQRQLLVDELRQKFGITT